MKNGCGYRAFVVRIQISSSNFPDRISQTSPYSYGCLQIPLIYVTISKYLIQLIFLSCIFQHLHLTAELSCKLGTHISFQEGAALTPLQLPGKAVGPNRSTSPFSASFFFKNLFFLLEDKED